MLDLNALLRTLAESSGSDLHLIVGQPPIIRVDGELRRLPGSPIMPDDTGLVAKSIIPPDRRDLSRSKRRSTSPTRSPASAVSG